jgi:riboflavin kinase/FMN adenylyltransferase
MEVITDLDALSPSPRGAAVTIGAFDGVHFGHRAVLNELRRLADERALASVVVTFDRHPASIVRPESAPLLLMDLDQKLEALEATGDVDRAVVVRFDKERSQEEAGDFVDEVLVGRLGARLVVVGEDFHFGRGRRGNLALLRQKGLEKGFDVIGLSLVGDRQPVSSTQVRRLVAAGDVATAGRLLGRPYEVRGVVRRGDSRGRALGFPTANVAVPAEILLPGDGIYAGWYDRRRPGEPVSTHATAISVGQRPTFPGHDGQRSVLEAYLLDFDGRLYGEPATVRFVERLREEERFDTVEALVAQIETDVDLTRAALDL